MQTDLRRVIRTQHNTDDHCQATNPLIDHDLYFNLIKPAVLCLPNPPRAQIHPQRRHRPPRPQTRQPPPQRQL